MLEKLRITIVQKRLLVPNQ